MLSSSADGQPRNPPVASPASASSYRILIVEDDPDIARLIAVSLRPLGMDCRYAADGEAALLAFEQVQPHLVLLDLMLPKIDGRTVCAKIRETSTVPVILMTAADSEEVQLQSFKVGADDYVTKPFSPKLLLARIVAQLRRVYRYDTDSAEDLVRQRDMAAIQEEVTQNTQPQGQTRVPAGWANCDACGYMGPRLRFETENAIGERVSICPNCGQTEHIVFSIG